MPQTRSDRLRLQMPLLEADIASPDRREVEVTCVRPGLSRNGNFYPASTLAAAVPLFEDARCFIDHSSASTRSVRDLCGSFHGARLREADGAVRATLRVSKAHEWLWQLICEALESEATLVGLSIDALAQTRMGEVDGKHARIVEAITGVQSVDVVARPAAGGSFDALLEADRQSWWDQLEPANELAAEYAAASARTGLPAAAQQAPVAAGVTPAGWRCNPAC